MIHLHQLADIPGYVAVAALVIVAGWLYASGPGRRARQRRNDAWMRKIRYTIAKGGESARGTP